MSYTSLKRRFTPGSTVRVNNRLHPSLSGIRTVIKQQTKKIATGPAVDAKGEVVPEVWMTWPSVAEVNVWEPEVEGEGVPRVEVLDGKGGVAISYELLEES